MKKMFSILLLLIFSLVVGAQTSSRPSLQPQKKNGKWGLVNKTGTVVTPFVYDYIGDEKRGSTLVSVNKDGKFGQINIKTGKLVIPCIYDEEMFFYKNTKWVPTKKEGKWGVIERHGTVLVPFIYDWYTEKDTDPDPNIKSYEAYLTIDESDDYDLKLDDEHIYKAEDYYLSNTKPMKTKTE